MKKKILLAVIAGLILIPPIVALAADVTIDNDVLNLYWGVHDGGIYWTSNETGYAIYLDNDGAYDVPSYRKTTNGGVTWSSTTHIFGLIGSGTRLCLASWSDWQTPNDLGTLIYIVTHSYSGSLPLEFGYLDTYDDTTEDGITIETLAGTTNTIPDWRTSDVSIAKTVGGKLAVAYRAYLNNYGFETSIDGGNTWITKLSPWEAAYDLIKLYPANLSDQNDLWAVFWDTSENELSLKTYDDSTNSWDEDLISENMTEHAGNLYQQWDGDIRDTDGHLIFAAWDEYNTVNSTLKVWDIANGDNITSLTDIVEGSGMFQTDVFIDDTSNRIYISYFKGTPESSVAAYYQYSDDWGISWSGEISYTSTADDHRLLFTAGMNPALGGRYMPVWYNDDLHDLATNQLNSINIPSNTYSNPAIAPEYVIDCPECTDNLTSSGNFTSNETFSGGPPGFAVIDDAAGESGAAPIWLWGWVGMFAIIVPGFFVTYMERKHGAGNGNLILRMGLALIVMGLLVTWGRFDWWMIVLYLFIAAAPAFMSRQYDIGGAGGVSQHGWIGFCATSWIGLTIINRILEGQFLTASESSWWCSIQLFNEFRVFDLFTVPVLNFQFFTVGIPSLLRWDYSFFGGNAELIQYFLYTITAVVAFILFCILIGLLFNAFRAR